MMKSVFYSQIPFTTIDLYLNCYPSHCHLFKSYPRSVNADYSKKKALRLRKK